MKIMRKSENPSSQTHLTYVGLISDLSNNIKITSIIIPKLVDSDGKGLLKDKISLFNLTKKSIEQDYKIVNSTGDYASLAILWLPIKSYYLIYHLLCLIDYIITGQKSSLKIGHNDCINKFTKRLGNLEMQFNQPLLNMVVDEKILNFITKKGENLKLNTPNDTIYKLIMKNVAKYKVNDYRSRGKLKNRKKINDFKKDIKVSVFDFFYIMRLKMNYGNPSFTNLMSPLDAKLYFEKYYEFTNNFYNCLFDWMKELAKNCPKAIV